MAVRVLVKIMPRRLAREFAKTRPKLENGPKSGFCRRPHLGDTMFVCLFSALRLS